MSPRVRLLIAAVAAMGIAGAAAPALASPPGTSIPIDDPARQAALEIAAARERANAAAEEYFVAEAELERLDQHRQALELEVADLEQVVARMERSVTQVAVNRY